MGVGLFGVALSFNASVLDPFIYSEKVRVLAPPGFKNTALGGITILALLLALLVQPLVGQLSDRTRSRWGPRIPYLTVGAAGLSGALAVVVLADNFVLLILGALLVSAFANTNQAAWQALIPDQVPVFQHGRAAGIKTVLELVGIVAGVAVAGFFLARSNLWGAPLVTAGSFWVILAITLVFLPRYAQSNAVEAPHHRRNPFSALGYAIRHAPPGFLWWMLNRFLFWAAAITIRTFLLNYLEDVLHLTPADAQALSSRILIILGLGVFFLAVPAGAVADHIGRRPILIAAGFMAAAGTLVAIIWQDINMLYVAGALIAAGTGIFASASWALATDLSPTGQGALYLALANAATILGSIGGRTGGVLIDAINQLLGTLSTGYLVNFGVAALFFFVSSLVALKVPERHV